MPTEPIPTEPVPNEPGNRPHSGTPSGGRPVRRRPRHLRGWIAVGASAAGLTALATAGLAGTAGTAVARHSDHSVMIADSYGTRTLVIDGVNASPSPSASAAAATGKAPQMRLQLAYKRTGPNLALTVSLDGFVFEPLDAAGKPMTFPTPATAAIGMGQNLAWGDGTGIDSKSDKARCGTPQKLHQVKDAFTLNHTYTAPGTFNVVYTFLACGLTDGKITATIPITVS